MKLTRQQLLLALIWLLSVGLASCAISPRSSSTDSSKSDRSARSTSKSEQAAGVDEFNGGIELLHQKKFSEAEKTFSDLANSNPTLSGPVANLGIVYYQSNRLPEAQKALEKAATLNPKNAAVHNYLGMIHRQSGRFTDAKAAYQKAQAANPQYAFAYLNLGILYDLYLNDPANALEQYKQYQALQQSKDKQVDMWIVDIEKRSKIATGKSKEVKP